MVHMLYQPPIDEKYTRMPADEAQRRIAKLKAALGDQLCILGHHYQRDAIYQFADFTGDSLKLSRQAAAVNAKYVVFCGVHFMAESADILRGPQTRNVAFGDSAPPDRVVILPDLSAGCAMAEMADADDVADALDHIAEATDAQTIPVTYVNSSAALKALTGRRGGACCTSSNVRNVFEWALSPRESGQIAPRGSGGLGGAGGEKILAVPDQHLARNTAVAMGYGLDDCVVYDPKAAGGGLTDSEIRRAKFILWKGHCYVHQRFTVEQVAAVRRAVPGVKVMVHPECPHPVFAAADLSGSTEQILRTVSEAAPGSKWAIGTEANMVNRLAAANPDKLVRVLADTPPLCVTMARIDLPHLLWVLEELAAGRVVNRVRVAEDVAADARLALERMVNIKAATTPMKGGQNMTRSDQMNGNDGKHEKHGARRARA